MIKRNVSIYLKIDFLY